MMTYYRCRSATVYGPTVMPGKAAQPVQAGIKLTGAARTARCAEKVISKR